MEKLIELLNEYEMENDNYSGVISEGDVYYYSVLYISKKFGFIKWLVENDKIDDDKCDVINDIYNDELPSKYTRYDAILMGLAIQDNQIEFLISILK